MSLLLSLSGTGAPEMSGFLPAPFVAGTWYESSPVVGGGNNASAGGVTADLLYAVPFYVGPRGFDADRIAVHCTASNAGNFRAGVYTHNAVTFRPSTLLLDGGTTAVGGTGFQQTTVDWTITAPGPHYLVWLAAVFSATPTINQFFGAINGIFGWDTGAGVAYAGLYMAHTFGALPATFSASPTLEASARRIFLRNG
jgi:hypothetical protein